MKNVLIADACSLILLAKTGLIEPLAKVVRIETTYQVLDECFKDVKRLDAQIIKLYVDKRIITARTVDFEQKGNLGIGEESVFATYRKLANTVIVTDDGKAIKYCRLMNYVYTTTPLILLSLWKKKKISRKMALSAIHTLEHEGRYSKDIIAHLLLTIGG